MSRHYPKTKSCTKCHTEKELNDFHEHKGGKFGRHPVCKSCRSNYRKQHYLANTETTLKQNSQWKKANRAAIAKYQKLWEANRLKTDPLYKLNRTVRSLVSQSLRNKNYTKKSKTFEIIGCSFEVLQVHLEITWENNYGTKYEGQPVHIDHIIPISSATTEEELIKLNHWTNLQYLTPEDNRKKGASNEPTLS